MKLRLPSKLVAAILAAASPVLLQTLSSATLGAAAVATVAGGVATAESMTINSNTNWAWNDVTHQGDTVTITGNATLKIGNGSGGKGDAGEGGVSKAAAEYIVNGGSTLNIWAWSGKQVNASTTNKVTIDSAITLNSGSSLWLEDGSYVFGQPITVNGAATISNNWDKGQVITSLVGGSDADLTLKRVQGNSVGHFYLTAANEEYSGRVHLENTSGSNFYLYVLNGNALKNAALDLGNSGYTKNQLQVEASGMTLRALSGQGYIQRSSGYTSSAVDVHVTGQGEAAFEGAVGGNVNLYIDDGATQLIGSLLDLDSNSKLIFSSGSTIDLRMTGTGGTFEGYGISPDDVSDTGNGFEYRTGAAYKIVKQGGGTLTINEGTNWKVGGEAVDASKVVLNGSTATINALSSGKGVYHVNTGEVNYTDAAALGATGYTTGDNGTLVLNGDAASAKAILRSATAGTGTLALHTTGRVELGNNEGVTFTGTLRVDNTISGADFHIGNNGAHVVDMSSLKAIELTDGSRVRYDAKGGTIKKVVINSGSGSWYTEDMLLQTGAEKPNLLTINEAAVNGTGTQLTFEGSWKSNIKLALLTGSGTLEVKSGSSAGEDDKTYFAIDSLQGFSGVLKLTQNHQAGTSWGKPVFNQLTADINTGSGEDVTISGLTVTDKNTSGAVVNLAGSQKLTVNGALTVGANSTLNIGSNEAAAHLGIQNGALSGTLHLNNGDFTFGSGSSVAGSTTAAIEMAEGTTIHVGSTIINSGALTISGTGAIDVDGLTLTGTNHVARTDDNGYGTMDAVYQLVSGTAATLSEGTNITWKNGEETLSGTFDGNVLNLGTVADTNYFINEANSTVNLTTETSSVTLGGAAKNSGTTHLTLTGIGTGEAPVNIKRTEYSADGILNLTLAEGAVAEINTSSGSSSVVNGDVTINASTLVLTGSDRVGWGTSGLDNLNMQGTAEHKATLLLNDRQTFSTVLNMSGNTLVDNISNSTSGSLELFWSGNKHGSIVAEGTNNVINTAVYLRASDSDAASSSEINVASGGELTVNGYFGKRNGGSGYARFNKEGAGTLTLNGQVSVDRNSAINAGKVVINSNNAVFSETLTVAASAALEIGETGVVSLSGLNTASVIHNAGSLTLSGEVNLNRALDTSIATFSEGTYGYLQSITQRVTDGTGTVTANNVTWKVGGQTADYFGLTTTTFNDGVLSMSNVSESAPKRWFMNTGEGGDFTYTGAPEQEMTSILINAKYHEHEGDTPVLHLNTNGEPTTLTEIIVNNTTAKIDLGNDAVLTKESGMLKLSNNGSAKLTGTGTYVLAAGETQLAANSGISLDENWRGVMRLSGGMNAVTFSQAERRANADSWVELAGVFGYIHWSDTTSNAKLILTDAADVPAFKMQDSSGKTYTFTNTVKGSGTFESAIKADTGYRNNSYKFSGDVSEWTGKFLSSSAKGEAGNAEGNTVLLFNNTATVINAAVESTGTAKLTLKLENSSAVTMNGDITKAKTAGELNIEASAPATFTGNVAADKLTINNDNTATFNAAEGKTQSIGSLAGSGTLKVTGTAATETAPAKGGLLIVTGASDNFTGGVTLGNTNMTAAADTVGLVVQNSTALSGSVVNFESGNFGFGTTNTSSLLAFRNAEGEAIDGFVAGLNGNRGKVVADTLTINVNVADSPSRDPYAFQNRYDTIGSPDSTNDAAVLEVNKLVKTGVGTQIIGGEYTEGDGLVIVKGIEVQQGTLHMKTRGKVTADIKVAAGATFQTSDDEHMADTADAAMHYNGKLTLNGTETNTATLFYADGSTYIADGLEVNGYGKVVMNNDTTQFIGGLNSAGETPSVLTLERNAKSQEHQNTSPRYIVVNNAGDFNGTIKMNNKADNNAFGIVAAGEDAQSALAGAVVDFTDSTNNAIIAFVKNSSMKAPGSEDFISNFQTYEENYLTSTNLLNGSVAGLTGTKGDVYANNLTINTANGANYNYGGALHVSSLTKTGAGSQTISGTGAFTATAATVTEGSLILNHTGEAITLSTLTITGGALYYSGGSTLTATMAGSKKQDTSAAGNITATNGTISLSGADSTLLELGANGADAVVNVANNLDIEQIRLQNNGTVNITGTSTVTAKKLWVEESSSSAVGGTINLSDSAELAVTMTGAWGFQMAEGKSINVADEATFTLNSANGEKLVITAKDAQQSAVIGATALVKQYTTGSADMQISHADMKVSKTDTAWTLGHQLTDTNVTNTGSGKVTLSYEGNKLGNLHAKDGDITVGASMTAAGFAKAEDGKNINIAEDKRLTVAGKTAITGKTTDGAALNSVTVNAAGISKTKDATAATISHANITVGTAPAEQGLLALADAVSYTISDVNLVDTNVVSYEQMTVSNVALDAASSITARNGSTLEGSNRLTLSAGVGIRNGVIVESNQLTGLTLTSGSNLTLDLSAHGYAADAHRGDIFTIELSGFSWEDFEGTVTTESYAADHDGASLNDVFKVLALGSTDTYFNVISVAQGVRGGAGITLNVEVPEPTTSVLSLLALAGMAARRRRK